jgi:sodium/hydrogen exchanger 8
MPILSLATFGVLFSTTMIAAFTFAISYAVQFDFSIIEALILGAILSSTDPTSVLQMLPENTDRNLFMLIFGESALNDAIAIILFRFFRDLYDFEEKKHHPVGFSDFLFFMLQALWSFVGSCLIGIAVALIFAKMTKHVKFKEGVVFELLLFLVFAYMSYLICDILGIFFL